MNKRICSGDDCFSMIHEDDVELSSFTGEPYLPSLKCEDCRTPQDRKKIKRFRKVQRKKKLQRELQQQ